MVSCCITLEAQLGSLRAPSRGGRGQSGREAQERGDTCLLRADSLIIQQKLTQHCKTTVFKLKKKATSELANLPSPTKYSVLSTPGLFLLT